MERWAAVARAAAGRHFRLSEVGAVGDSTCLLVADEKPFDALRSELLEAVGGDHGVNGSLPFHLTISRGDSPSAGALIRRTLEPRLPLECEIGDLTVAALSAGHLSLIAIERPDAG